MFYLLRRNIVGCRSHVDLLVNIQTGDDKEHSWTPGTTLYQSPQSEDDSSLVLLRFEGNANIQSPSKETVQYIRLGKSLKGVPRPFFELWQHWLTWTTFTTQTRLTGRVTKMRMTERKVNT